MPDQKIYTDLARVAITSEPKTGPDIVDHDNAGIPRVAESYLGSPAKSWRPHGLTLISLVIGVIVVITGSAAAYMHSRSGSKPSSIGTAAQSASKNKPISSATSPIKTAKPKQSPTKPQTKPVQKTTPSKAIQQTPQLPAQKTTSTQPYVGSLPSTVPVNSVFGFNFYYAGGRQYATAAGATVDLSQAQPVVPEQFNAENHSLMELAVQSSNGEQTVEVGWVVDKTMNGDELPHLFVYHWVDGQTSCYDGCGFVQVSSTITPGQAVTVGATGSYGISYSSGNWNITYNGAEVGYYPGSLWGGTYTQLGYVQVFGEVAISNNSTTKCIQMGNSLPGTNSGSAKISNFTLVGSSTVTALSPYATSQSSYSYGFASARGLNLGGPGSC